MAVKKEKERERASDEALERDRESFVYVKMALFLL